MHNAEIEKIFNRIRKNKNLDYDSYVFYLPNLKRDRIAYEMYLKSIGRDKKDNLLSSAVEYTKRSDQFFGVSLVGIVLADSGNLKNSQINTFNMVENRLFAQSLEVLSDTMEASGITDSLIDRHNVLCAKNGVDVLKIEKEQVLNEFDVDKNSRSKLISLYMKNMFWLNKYIKMFNGFETQSIFDESIKNNRNLEKNEIYYLLYMAYAKYEICKQIYSQKACSSDDKIDLELCKAYSQMYRNEFCDIFPQAENNIFNDYARVSAFEEAKDSLYHKKDFFNAVLLRSQMIEKNLSTLNPGIKYWGITIDELDQSVIFRLEPEGYMLPVSVHMPRFIYEDSIAAFGVKKYEFPQMDAIKRLDDKSKIFSTNVLAKPTPEQTKQIKAELKKGGEQREFLKRVLEQINGKPHSFSKPQTIILEIGE